MSKRQNCEIWCVDLAVAAPALHAVEQRTPRLSAADLLRASAFSRGDARDEWLAAHIALRLVIERACGPQWRGVPLSREARGKPHLDRAPIAFSLSHAPGLALIGLAHEGCIGVDVERTRTVRIGAERRARILAAGAGAAERPLPAGGDARFLQAWVRLEAIAKADGCGIGRLLTRLGILGSGARASVGDSEMRGRAVALLAEGPATCVYDLELGEGRFAAAALGGPATVPTPRWLPSSLEDLERPIN